MSEATPLFGAVAPGAPDPSKPAYACAVVVRRLSLHSELGERELEALDRVLGRPSVFPPRALIAAAGDEADYVTVMQSGFAVRTSVLPNGRRQIHSLLLTGDTADAEAPLLGVRGDNLEALNRCSAWRLPKSRLALLVQTHPLLAAAFAREAAIAAQVTREWVVSLGRRTAIERIAHLFCELHARMDALGLVADGVLSHPLSQLDTADAHGLSSVHVNRVLQDLRGRGLIVLQRGRLTLLDVEGLRRLALFNPLYLHLGKAAA